MTLIRHVLESARALIAALRTKMSRYASRQRETRVEVLVTGSGARVHLRTDISHALCLLARLLGTPPLQVKVLVQHRLSEQTDVRSATEHLAVGEGTIVLIRPAVWTDRKELSRDDILAALTDEYVALLKSVDGGSDGRRERASLKVMNRPADPLVAISNSQGEACK